MHQYIVQTGADVSLTAATAKTALQLITGSTRRLKLLELMVSGSSVTATDAPLLIELRLQSTAGTSSANTPSSLDRADPAAIFTALDTFTAEPTDAGLVGPGPWRMTPSGLFVYQFPDNEEFVMAVSTRLGLRLTSPASQTGVRAYLKVQE